MASPYFGHKRRRGLEPDLVVVEDDDVTEAIHIARAVVRTHSEEYVEGLEEDEDEERRPAKFRSRKRKRDRALSAFKLMYLDKNSRIRVLPLVLITIISLIIVFLEVSIFHLAIARPGFTSSSGRNDVHAILIADPQLTDHHSYTITTRFPLLGTVVNFYSDIYMKRAYRLIQLYHGATAEVTFILGDLIDSTKYLDDVEYVSEVQRFRWVFRSLNPESLPVHYLSGNHDIGYEIGSSKQGVLAARFQSNFGPLNTAVDVGGVTFVMLSATTAESRPNTNSVLSNETTGFVESFRTPSTGRTYERRTRRARRPHILLTHIPLWRTRDTPCLNPPTLTGEMTIPSHRRHNIQPNVRGYSYRTTLPRHVSEWVLAAVRPIYVLSGDDHDTCHIVHTNPAGVEVPETTVGTFSWLQGTSHPSFALLTVSFDPHSEVDDSYVSMTVLYLPQQRTIYLFYALVAAVSLITLIWYHSRTGLWRDCTYMCMRPCLQRQWAGGVTRGQARPGLGVRAIGAAVWRDFVAVFAVVLVVYLGVLLVDVLL